MQIYHPCLWTFGFSKAGVEPRKLNVLETFPRYSHDQPHLEPCGQVTYCILYFYQINQVFE